MLHGAEAACRAARSVGVGGDDERACRPAATTPDAGVTVSHGCFDVAVNDWPASSGPRTMV